jgi:polyisoprenyl-phosphate glycosyltransferase
MLRVCLVIPAYNDWDSLLRLLVDLSAVGQNSDVNFRVIVVDDSSTVSAPEAWPNLEWSRIESLKIVRLACNLGHQRAIAVGLVISKEDIDECAGVVVMDGDGEDLPSDVPRLLAASALAPGAIVCARRTRRSEPLFFRACYQGYKALFGSLTGAQIDFGNFCLIPKSALRPVISQAGIWNHLAATLTRSRLPLTRIDSFRGVRYAGRSKMNLVSLVVHGLTAVAVYADVALVRILIAAMVLAACAFIGIVVTVCVRLGTSLAIPGWASSVAGTLTVLLFQAVLVPVIGVFVVLSSRTARTVVPSVDAQDFVESIRTIASED